MPQPAKASPQTPRTPRPPSFWPLMAALALVSGTAQAADLPNDLAKAVRDYDQAQIHGDKAELERLVADDYVLVNSSGKVDGKAELIAGYVGPGNRLDPFVVRDPVERVWADGAVMGGVATLSGLDGGKPYRVTLRFADIWAKRGGVWRVVYTHVSRPPQP